MFACVQKCDVLLLLFCSFDATVVTMRQKGCILWLYNTSLPWILNCNRYLHQRIVMHNIYFFIAIIAHVNADHHLRRPFFDGASITNLFITSHTQRHSSYLSYSRGDDAVGKVQSLAVNCMVRFLQGILTTVIITNHFVSTRVEFRICLLICCTKLSRLSWCETVACRCLTMFGLTPCCIRPV